MSKAEPVGAVPAEIKPVNTIGGEVIGALKSGEYLIHVRIYHRNIGDRIGLHRRNKRN